MADYVERIARVLAERNRLDTDLDTQEEHLFGVSKVSKIARDALNEIGGDQPERRTEEATARFLARSWEMAERLAEANEWQPIETAPRDGHRVLLAVGGDVWWIAIGYYAGGWWNDTRPQAELLPTPTHWMPLPGPPS